MVTAFVSVDNPSVRCVVFLPCDSKADSSHLSLPASCFPYLVGIFRLVAEFEGQFNRMARPAPPEPGAETSSQLDYLRRDLRRCFRGVDCGVCDLGAGSLGAE
jgi:hypothetical protein